MIDLIRPFRTSVGSKFLMSLTGLGLIGFVIVHMIGNLLIFAGRDALNSYAHMLKENSELLWFARGGLLTLFVVHVVLGVRLTLANLAARPVKYAYEDTVQASWASRHMLLTGLVLLAFTIYHLAHFTFGWVAYGPEGVNYLSMQDKLHDPAHPRQDVYNMVVAGFQNPIITGTYLVSMFFLWLHLWHGGSSWFQSIGLNHPRYWPVIQYIGPVIATVVLIGNCSIPLAVLSGVIPWVQ
jgi:succinate dehydrogenase / fumarate reductase, cytochrome b subunit